MLTHRPGVLGIVGASCWSPLTFSSYVNVCMHTHIYIIYSPALLMRTLLHCAKELPAGKFSQTVMAFDCSLATLGCCNLGGCDCARPRSWLLLHQLFV